MELRFTENENDYLVFGIDEEFVIKTSDNIEGTLENFCEHMKNEHNLIIQAHPFRGNCKAANPEYLDGVETFNMHPGQNSKNSFALKFAKENNLIQIAGTDFHHPGMECLTALLTKKPIENSFELSEVLKSTDYLFEIGGDIVIPYIK
jgi:predicted metal-dependent phosphoesterase TrpH